MIKRLWKNNKYKFNIINRLKRILPDITENDLDTIINNTTDLEFYAYFHSKFKETNNFKNFDIIYKKYFAHMYELKIQELKKISKIQGKILDIGTENDHFINCLNKLENTDAIGINVGFFESYSGDRNNIIIYDGINIPFADNTFDIITIQMVIHHMIDQKKTIHDAYRVLKKGGRLIILEHDFSNENNLSNDYIDVYHFFYELIENREFNSIYYNNYFIKRTSKNDLVDLFKNIGFKYSNKLNKRYSKPKGPLRKYYSIFIK
jgi:SAM-dependent methyltransferase